MVDQSTEDTPARPAGHSRLLKSWWKLRSQIGLSMVQRNRIDGDSRRGTVQGHQQLLRAMQTGKADEAAAVVELHLDKQYQ